MYTNLRLRDIDGGRKHYPFKFIVLASTYNLEGRHPTLVGNCSVNVKRASEMTISVIITHLPFILRFTLRNV